MAETYRKAIQFMIANGCVKFDQFRDFLQTFNPERSTQLNDQNVFEAVSNLNKKFRRYNLMIRLSTDDRTHERYYVLISTVDNAITKQASHHTAKEFEYFKLIWEELVSDETTTHELKCIAQQNKVLNHKDLLQEWHDKHWIVIDGDMVRLGVRSRAELDVMVPTASGERRES